MSGIQVCSEMAVKPLKFRAFSLECPGFIFMCPDFCFLLPPSLHRIKKLSLHKFKIMQTVEYTRENRSQNKNNDVQLIKALLYMSFFPLLYIIGKTVMSVI